MAPTITLGRHTIEVEPQSLPRLNRDVKALAAKVPALAVGFDGMTDLNEVLAEAGSVVLGLSYEAVCVLIPEVARRIPAYEFAGFASREAMDLEDYDDAALDAAPTVPQIREAIRVGVDVNGLEFLGKMGKLKGMDLNSILSQI
jgi:hypothetical protein